MKTIDLFAGIGGIRTGFESIGFETVFSNDFEPKVKVSYDLNYGKNSLTLRDIRDIQVEELPKFDFLLGGFPCQAFSIAGYRQGFEDTAGRGNLFFYIAKILDYHRPQGFLLENVKNLVSHDNGKTMQIILETLEGLGYTVKHKIMNTCEYGNLPQNRERVYIVGFLNKKIADNFEFPDKIKLTKTIPNILEQNVNKKYYYTESSILYQKLKETVISKNTCYQWRRVYVRENKNNLCPTLTANMGTGGHNVPIVLDDFGIRKLTPRECLRLQGFSDNFKIPDVANSHIYKQAGNSVSVSVVRRIAEKVKIAIESKNVFLDLEQIKNRTHLFS
jgi:DNA (cytosine-5)-methyltransferase 1